jgi:hypothetical protein
MSPAIPRETCPTCLEYLPHYCAEVVTITRQRRTGKRVVTITARVTEAAA